MKAILLFFIFLLVGCGKDSKTENSTDTDRYVAYCNDSIADFIINTPEQLFELAKLVNAGDDFSGKNIILGANITLNDTTDWQNWEKSPPANRWMPIGNNKDIKYEGVFNGCGFVVSGAYIDNPNEFQGLFGYLGVHGIIKNLGVIASYVKGSSAVGGLIGSNDGEINNCHFNGVVMGTNAVGGLAGRSFGEINSSYTAGKVSGEESVGGLAGNCGCTIANSYSIASVTGTENVGGLAGHSFGDIINGNYFAGTVTGTEKNIGGLVGNKWPGYFERITMVKLSKNIEWFNRINNYYDNEKNGQGDADEGKTTAQMKQERTFEGWDFTNVWGISDEINEGYPYLLKKEKDTYDYDITWYNQSKSEFTISGFQQLAGFAKLVNEGNDFKGKMVKLKANIMLNDTTDWQNWEKAPPANRWMPIGTEIKMFNGTFDGNGFIISGVYINSSKELQGLFGRTGSSGIIKNLGIKASFIKGGKAVFNTDLREIILPITGSGRYTGGLVGGNGGIVNNCYFIGNVMGIRSVGGLAGYNNGEINASYSVVDVIAVWGEVGGLVGWNAKKGKVNNSISFGNLFGQLIIGGLVGTNDGEIIDGYFTGSVLGTGDLGGLAGNNGSGNMLGTGIIRNSYSRGTVTGEINVGTSSIGGFVGSNYVGSTINNSYSSCIVTGYSYVGGFVGWNEGSISNSFSTGVVTGTAPGYAVGGFVGWNTGPINSSYSTGSVTGTDEIGGFAGTNFASVSNSYSTGAVLGEYSVGKFIGSNNGSISNSYSIGTTMGKYLRLDELVGNSRYTARDLAVINNSYYVKETSEPHDKSEDKGEAKTMVEMKQKATFKGWDFDKIWGINENINEGYPYLLFEELL